MLDRFFPLLFLALVSATMTVTLTRASIFERPRRWLSEKSVFLGKLLACPYCSSHWVAFALVGVYRPQVLVTHWAVNFFAVSFSVVTLTAFFMGGMFAAFQHIPPPKVDEEEDAG